MNGHGVLIREVGPRDGLQAEAPVAVADRVALVGLLASAGLTDIEVAAFVSPAAVPAMAGAAEVMVGVAADSTVRHWALVPNARGAEMAVAAGADALTVTVSASPEYNRRNVAMSVDESVGQVVEISELAGGRPVDAVISCAFGSPYEGDMDPGAVAALGDRLIDSGATALTYADTTGMGTPRRVRELLAETGVGVGLHLHETRGTALVNAFTALENGVTRFDTAVGGLGGSPFAPGAGGNLATEDLVHLLDDLGIDTGVDLDAVLAASEVVGGLVGHAVPSRIAAAGPRSRLARAGAEGA